MTSSSPFRCAGKGWLPAGAYDPRGQVTVVQPGLRRAAEHVDLASRSVADMHDQRIGPGRPVWRGVLGPVSFRRASLRGHPAADAAQRRCRYPGRLPPPPAGLTALTERQPRWLRWSWTRASEPTHGLPDLA